MLVPLALVLLMVASGATVVTVTRRGTGLPSHADRALRHDRLVRALALGTVPAAVLCSWLWAVASPLRGALAVPLGVVLGSGIGYLTVLTLGQLTWPRPTAAQRRARLGPRDVRDLAGDRATRLIGVPLVVLLLAVVVPALTQPLDGPTGDNLSYWDDVPSVLRSILDLPWPGLRYGFPALLGVAVLLGLARLALRTVADRATVADAGADWDRTIRATAARRIVTLTAGVLATAGGVLVLAAGSRLAETTDGSLVVGGVLVLLGALWAAAGTVLAVVGVLWPARDTPAGLAAAGSPA